MNTDCNCFNRRIEEWWSEGSSLLRCRCLPGWSIIRPGINAITVVLDLYFGTIVEEQCLMIQVFDWKRVFGSLLTNVNFKVLLVNGFRKVLDLLSRWFHICHFLCKHDLIIERDSMSWLNTELSCEDQAAFQAQYDCQYLTCLAYSLFDFLSV